MKHRKKAMKEAEFFKKLEEGELDSEQVESMLPHFYWRGVFSAIGWMFSAIVFAVAIFLLLTRVFHVGTPKQTVGMLSAEEESKIMELKNLLKTYYYEDVDDETIQDGIYYGIMESAGDIYTRYYSQEELKSLNADLQGAFGGIGATMQMDMEKGYIRVISIVEDSPASRSDIKIGDYIYKVDGESMYGLTISEVVDRVRGEEGTQVNLTLLRDGSYVDVTVTREIINTPTVEYEMLEGGIAYIKIKEFDEVTTKQFIDAKQQMLSEQAEGLILDLRGNPGGIIDGASDIANEIIPKGLVVYTEDKNGHRMEFKADGKGELKIPIVVLVNGNSASAAEILAGAIKDYNKGTLIGTKTFGKGIVQTVIRLRDGSAVKVTSAKYFTPKGINIHKTGIEPDIEVKLDSEAYLENGTDNQLDYAIDYLKKQLKKATDDTAA